MTRTTPSTPPPSCCATRESGGSDLQAAIFAYNHADWYVDKVVEQASKYVEAAATSVGSGDLTPR